MEKDKNIVQKYWPQFTFAALSLLAIGESRYKVQMLMEDKEILWREIQMLEKQVVTKEHAVHIESKYSISIEGIQKDVIRNKERQDKANKRIKETDDRLRKIEHKIY